ncbi:hypothetical protein OIU84_024759 [Salix udensis]|uniref:Uncharacterized protein n=1 Tax=Salix udensis TaxID=889485 RepID=A0AAD6KHZ1_9ROSI|nr:hypothetical protein OIU84_024759 [Salix udensis]
MTPPAATFEPPSHHESEAPQLPRVRPASGGAWCIASSTASQTALQTVLQFNQVEVVIIQTPSVIMLLMPSMPTTRKIQFLQAAVLAGAAQLTNTDPSSGNCHYASSPTTPPSVSPPVNPAPPPPASTTTTPTIASPGGPPTVYGVPEPVGQPSSATSVSCSLLILFSTTGIVGSLLATKHL